MAKQLHDLHRVMSWRTLQPTSFSSWWSSRILGSAHLLVSHVLGAVYWNEIKDLVTRIKMHIFKVHISKVKLPFYSSCEVKCMLQNGVSTVSWKVLLFITRWRSWNFLVTKPYGAQTQQLLQEIGQIRIPITLFFTLVKFALVELVSPFTAFKIIRIYV